MLIYDIEVMFGPDEIQGGWTNPEGMGFGTAVAYDTEKDQYLFYGPDKKQQLIEDLTSVKECVTFNGIKFDDRVLLGNDLIEAPWKNNDLLLMVVKGKFGCETVAEAEEKYTAKVVHDGSIGLDGLAEGTLGLNKTGHGSKAPDLIKACRWAEVYAYNLQDVRLTRHLWEFYQHGGGFLMDRHRNKINLLYLFP